jgi:hypothetical protein
MNKLLLVVCFKVCLCVTLLGQSDTSKIKVYLLGTFHFGNTNDANKTPFKDLYSAKRQTELNEIATSIIKAKTTKIFVEFPYFAPKELDSLGRMYSQNPNQDTALFRGEIFQVAFRTAKMNNTIKVVPVDRQMELPMHKLEEFDALYTDSIPFFSKPYKITKVEKQKKLSESTLQEYYMQLNTPFARKNHLADFLHWALASTHKSNFAGTEFTLSWYERNLKIFTNILRNIDPDKDKTIVVLLGASHTATIRPFFIDHDRFEVIELTDLF